MDSSSLGKFADAGKMRPRAPKKKREALIQTMK